jgi:hypothetical protein
MLPFVNEKKTSGVVSNSERSSDGFILFALLTIYEIRAVLLNSRKFISQSFSSVQVRFAKVNLMRMSEKYRLNFLSILYP